MKISFQVLVDGEPSNILEMEKCSCCSLTLLGGKENVSAYISGYAIVKDRHLDCGIQMRMPRKVAYELGLEVAE